MSIITLLCQELPLTMYVRLRGNETQHDVALPPNQACSCPGDLTQTVPHTRARSTQRAFFAERSIGRLDI